MPSGLLTALALLGLSAFCHGFAPAGFAPSCARELRLAGSLPFMERAAIQKSLRVLKGAPMATVMQGDNLDSMFSGTEQLKFDMTWSDSENIRFDGARATKTTESPPAFAVFGNDATSGIQRFGIKILKQVNSLTPAVMIGKGGSVYRTGRLGTKMVEYLGPELKRSMGKSYPPVFKEGDVVKVELNKDTQEVKMSVNDNAAFTVGGIDQQAKFFVNMEGVQSSVELVRIS